MVFILLSFNVGFQNVFAEEKNPSESIVKDTDTTMKDKGESSYDEIRERAEKNFLKGVDQLTSNSESDSDSDPVRDVWVYIFYIYDIVKGIAPALFVGFIMLGLLVAKLAKQNKGVRRFGIYGLCVTFPIILLIFVYCLPYLYDVFANA